MNNELISREALKKVLNFVYDCAYIDSKSKEGIVSDIIDEIDNAPTVKPKQGEWIIQPHSMIMRCSLCENEETAEGIGIVDTNKHFCSNCGAEMKGD